MKQIANWSPLHFLAALGAGGMVVTFFMFLLFLGKRRRNYLEDVEQASTGEY